MEESFQIANITGDHSVVFYVANACQFVAFVLPNNFPTPPLLMRMLLCVGQMSMAAWTYLTICYLDMIAWNIIHFAVNAVHALFLIVKMIPSRIPDNLRDLHLKLFQPLKVSKHIFKLLVKDSEVILLEEAENYATEGITSSDLQLVMLLSGKMKVTCDGAYLHYIYPNQFVDSPEWFAMQNGYYSKTFQVTITAEEQCECLVWTREKLEHILLTIPVLKATMNCLIGKDITAKLYSLSDCQTKLICPSALGKSAEPGLQRAHSADNVHIGNSGLVRSDVWLSSHTTDAFNEEK